jgi:hypothetical protein
MSHGLQFFGLLVEIIGLGRRQLCKFRIVLFRFVAAAQKFIEPKNVSLQANAKSAPEECHWLKGRCTNAIVVNRYLV